MDSGHYYQVCPNHIGLWCPPMPKVPLLDKPQYQGPDMALGQEYEQFELARLDSLFDH